ncbi:isoleucine--tRNA ligase [Candidatus Woesearchaeota archaeon]|nr:isoleucine--tRNA ligase [Candidatus Woesearchaeota archaeon]
MGSLSVKEREAAMRERWRGQALLDQLRAKRKGAKKYFLLDGPPYANYVPHVGHIRNTVYKDLYVRWNFMKGKDVLFQPGFDTHGLPIENMVEKRLGLKSKKDIQKLGIQSFMRTCKESAALNKDLWMETYDLLGSWYAWKEPYLTYENSYIESVWWGFKQLWDKGMAYEGKRPVFWCPQCETALAGYEATDSYKNVTDPAIYVKFKLTGEEASLLVYTTTPWTLPANCAVMVAPKEDYVRARTKEHGDLILAKERLPLLRELGIDHEIIETFKGKKLEGKRYEPLLDVPVQQSLKEDEHALRVYASRPILKERVGSKVAAKKGLTGGDVYEDFVTVTEGTGLVHCAPGHGKTDNEMGKHYGLPSVSPLDDQCRFTDEAGKFAGRFVKEADHDIAEELHQNGRLLHYGTVEHAYPLCWRCKSPLIFRLSDQWFLKTDSIKESMLEANDKVEWQPGFARERFAAWVANADDWNFSRQRYWGVPIPVWKGKSGRTLAIGSLEELKRLATTALPDGFDLHAANEVILKHPETGESMKRINDIFDVWFDSGSAPYASLGYPFKNKEVFEEHYPVDRVNESQDQIRGWFYSLMFCNIGVFGKAPYKTISMPGWVLDDKGEKMSKSAGNFIPAKETLEELGADAVRFYYCWDVSPGSTQKFNKETVKTDVRRFLTIWRNLVRLVRENGATFTGKEEPRSLEDHWLRSRLHTTIKEVREGVESFDINLAGRALHRFIVDDLSRTYVQLVRERMEREDLPAQLISASLWDAAKLSAAITPFQSEQAYLDLKGLYDGESEESVHLELLPVPDAALINEELEERMRAAGDVIAGILAARDKMGVGVRWPLQAAVVDVDDEAATAVKEMRTLIQRQANVKLLRAERFVVKHDATPDYQALGKAYGERTGDAITAFQQHKESVIEGVTGPVGKAAVGGFTFLPEHVNLEKLVPDTHVAGECKHGTVYVQKAVPRSLELEGYAREATRRLQQLRKEAGLQKQDRIAAVVVIGIADELQPFREDVAAKVGADELTIASSFSGELEHSSETKVKGETLRVLLEKRA